MIPLDAVGEDPALSPAEKETTIRFAKDRDVAQLFTAENGLMRRTISHPHADVQHVIVLDADDSREKLSPEDYAGGTVVGVTAGIPVGVLQVKSGPRSTTHHAEVVSDRVLAEGGGDR